MPPACIRSATTAVTGSASYFNSSSGNIVGGMTAGAGNVISGNANYGIHVLFGLNNHIEGNFIGTDATGMAAVGNGFDGVLIDNSSENTVQGNLISGNGRAGVDLIFRADDAHHGGRERHRHRRRGESRPGERELRGLCRVVGEPDRRDRAGARAT